MVGPNTGRESFSNSLSLQKKGHRHKNTWHTCPKWTLELDKIYGLRFSNFFISVSVNTGARTLSPTLVFTLQPADRQGAQVWLNHILFSRIPSRHGGSGLTTAQVVHTSQKKKKEMKQHTWLVKLLEKASLLVPQLSGTLQSGTGFSHGPRP